MSIDVPPASDTASREAAKLIAPAARGRLLIAVNGEGTSVQWLFEPAQEVAPRLGRAEVQSNRTGLGLELGRRLRHDRRPRPPTLHADPPPDRRRPAVNIFADRPSWRNRAVIETCRQQERQVFDDLTKAVATHFARTNHPSLVRDP